MSVLHAYAVRPVAHGDLSAELHECRLARKEHAGQVQVELGLEFLDRHFNRTARHGAADIVVQDVDLAIDLDAARDHDVHGFGIGNVGLQGRAARCR